jgi:alkylation response protein AidB-like acyl-CoA dehydrogenase
VNFAFNEEQEELRAMARDFLADHSSSEQVRSAMASEQGYDTEVWKRIGTELGWPAVLVPEEYGGLGLTWVELVALLETTGEALLCAPFFSTVCLGGNALLVAGSDAQKQQYLPALAEGQLRSTLAFSEPSGRWDADGITMVQDGVSLFAVPSDAAGLTVTALPTVDQTRRQAEVVLDGARVSAEASLGEPGSAWPALRKVLDLAAVGIAAEQVGGAQRCLDLSVEYAKERVQFGRVIGSFQAIKHKAADMMLAVECARSAAYYAGCVAAEDGDALPQAASLAKATCSEAYFRCAADAIQIFGGIGFTWEYDPHLHFKRAKSTESFLGDASWHRERIAQLIF